MANTTKIKKSKYLSYQKQGFLYLVFILFLFFSQAGEYVMHYTSLAKTQKALNTYLETRLSSLILEDASDDQYRNDVLNRLTSLEQISDRFDVYESQSIAGLDQYRENRFAERQVRRGELGTVFNATWSQQQSQSNGRWTPTELIDYNGSSSNATDFFFKETPNAVIPSLIEHAKTSFLVEALEELNKQALVFEKYNLELLEEAEFASVFKKRLFLGEDFKLTIHSEELKDSVETITINSKPQKLAVEGGKTRLVYRPQSWGKYFVEIQTSSQRFYTSFEVVRPRLRFVAQEELIDLTLGQNQSISIDAKLLPSSGFSFESDFAEVNYSSGVLNVKPTTVGEFTLRLKVNNQPLDSVLLGSRVPGMLKVTLADARGESCSPSEAHRVQSINPNFQVLSYTSVFYPKDGSESKTYNSLSRLIRPEMGIWAAQEGTLVIKEISLLSSNGITKTSAEPLIMSTNE
jgi:hypothetical protein